MCLFTKAELKDIRECYYSYLEGCVAPEFFTESDLTKLKNSCFPVDETKYVRRAKDIIKKVDKELEDMKSNKRPSGGKLV